MTEYTNLDLSLNGPIAKTLLDAIDHEASARSIAITSEHQADESRPAFLTPQMQEWLRAYIVPLRSPALQAIRQRFNTIEIGKGQHAFLLESEKDRINQKKFQEWQKERDQFFSDGEAEAVDRELEKKSQEYEYKKMANGGEDAHEWSKKKYIGILALLAAPEIPLNFESIMKLPLGMTPAMAVAMTALIAAGIAWSSHIYGLSIKQRTELFGGHVSNTDRTKHYIILSIATIVFLVAIGVIGKTRDLLFAEEMNRKILIGQSLKVSDYLSSIGVAVGGNFIIWLVGIGVAFAAHSHIPGFGDLKAEVDALKARLVHLYTRELQPRIERHFNKAQKDNEAKEMTEAKIFRNLPEYVAIRAEFEELKKADNQAIAILETYRSRLIDKINRSGKSTTFVMDDLSRRSVDTRTEISSDALHLKKIVLPYAQIS